MNEVAVAIQNDNKNVTPIETIDAIKKAGFKNAFVQWYNEDWACSQQEQLDYARKVGLNIICAHLGYKKVNEIWRDNETGEAFVERYKNDLRICKKNNILLVVMHLIGTNPEIICSEIGLRRIKEIVDYAEELGIKIAFENTKRYEYLEYVFSHLDNSNIGLCYDSGHCHIFFDDKFDYEFFKNRIFTVHLHDNDKSDDLHLMPFDGTIDWEHVMHQLKECHFEEPITLELTYRYHYLEMSIEEFYQKGYEVANQLAKLMK